MEEMAQTYLADPDPDPDPGAEGNEARRLRPLQAAAIAYRIAVGLRAVQ